jgi:hypothetical protein
MHIRPTEMVWQNAAKKHHYFLYALNLLVGNTLLPHHNNTKSYTLPSSTPIEATPAEQQEQHDDDNDKRCSTHGNFLPLR